LPVLVAAQFELFSVKLDSEVPSLWRTLAACCCEAVASKSCRNRRRSVRFGSRDGAPRSGDLILESLVILRKRRGVIFGPVKWTIFNLSFVLCVPKKEIPDGGQCRRISKSARLCSHDHADKILGPKDFVHHASYAMQILIADLHENAPGIC